MSLTPPNVGHFGKFLYRIEFSKKEILYNKHQEQ